MSTVYHNLKRLARVPVILALAGAYLNSAELLQEFQPTGRGWVGWLGALSVSVALFLCVEAFLLRPSWVTGLAVVGFGLAEISGQILHAALIRNDVVFMTDALRWLMAYLSPSVVVIVGVVMGFIVNYGFRPPDEFKSPASSDVAALSADLSSLADAIRQSTFTGGVRRSVRSSKASSGSNSVQLPLPVSGNGKGQ